MWPFADQPEEVPCDHDWIVVAKTFAPPFNLEDAINQARRGLTGATGRKATFKMSFTPALLERAKSGATTVLMVCELCGERSQHVLVGQERAG